MVSISMKNRLIGTKTYVFLVFVLIAYLATYSLYYARLFDYEYLKKAFSFATEDSLKNFMINVKQISWIFPVFTVLFIFMRISLTSFCLLIGTYSDGESIPVKKLFKISLIAELVYVFRDLMKIIYLFFQGETNVDEYAGSFSIYSFFRDHIPANSWITLPAKSISIYFFAYMVTLIMLYKTVSGKSLSKSTSFVSTYYILGFTLWIVLNMSFNNLFVK
ncbi:MAG: hypothetical protein ABI581_17700 [Sediminibacterium sp.]